MACGSTLIEIAAAVALAYLAVCVTIPLLAERRRNNDR